MGNHQTDLASLIAALGGRHNIVAVEPCVTRLRFELRDPDTVNTRALRPPLCFGATVVGHAVQVIVGPGADADADDLRALL